MADSDNILKGSISSASYSMVFQIVFRIVSFSINGIFLHNVDKQILGITNVRLLLLFSTILFISREAFRRACLSNTRNHNWPQVINLIWLMIPNMMLWSVTFCYIWLNWLELPSEEIVGDYKFAVYMTGLGCVIESFVEPIYLFSQAFLYVRLRLFVDVVILITRISSMTLTVLLAPEYTIQAFAWGLVAGSSSLVLLYTLYFYFQFKKKKIMMKNREIHRDDPLLLLPFNSLYDFLPRKIEGQSFIGYELAQLTWGFFTQGIMKQVLTEGERYIMTIFSVLSFAEQGIYDVVNNLGSLAARFLFLPIEESSYFYFAQMLHRDKPIDQQPKEDVQKAAHVLYVLLKGLTFLGLIILVFGFSYSHLLLSLYGGRTLTDGPGPLLLRAHCVCVLLLGINGVTEAFVFAAMNKARLDRHNGAMAIFTFIYLGLAWLFSWFLGGVGFILANCVNMTLRICYSLSFIWNHYRNSGENPLRGLVPSKTQLFAFLAAFLVTAWSESSIYQTSAVLHVMIGGICGVSVLATILYTEEELRSYLVLTLKKKLGYKQE